VGAELVPYNLDASNNWYPNFQELEANGLEGVKMMWVNYPHMPTGAPASMEVYAQLIAFGKKHNILICNDNPYSFILNPTPLSIMSVPGAKDVAIELNSLSKSHNMAGWRMGMIAGSEAHLAYILRVKSNMDSGMFRPMQSAAAKALTAGPEWFAAINKEYQHRKELALEILELIGTEVDPKQTGMFVWAKISNEWESGEAISEFFLHKANVFITPGHIFGSQGFQYIRLSLCSNLDMLREAKQRILLSIQKSENKN
jgi:aspartate/methionine/tyrosine aminotransferase